MAEDWRISSFLFTTIENGERNPWVDAKIVHDFSYRGMMAATYAEDVQRCYSLNESDFFAGPREN